MHKDTTAPHAPMPDRADLLHLAKAPTLHACSEQELRALVTTLERACEIARVAALRDIRFGPERPVSTNGAAGRNFGFAGLYMALRRAKSEIRRRETASSKPRPKAGKRGQAPPSRDGTRGRGVMPWAVL